MATYKLLYIIWQSACVFAARKYITMAPRLSPHHSRGLLPLIPQVVTIHHSSRGPVSFFEIGVS